MQSSKFFPTMIGKDNTSLTDSKLIVNTFNNYFLFFVRSKTVESVYNGPVLSRHPIIFTSILSGHPRNKEV